MKMRKYTLHVLLMALIMCIFALTSYADYEDGEDCWHCGHYHWDEYKCSCGACSSSCTNDDCFDATHCGECEACLLDKGVWCEDCMRCEDCYVDNLYHCFQCGECRFFGEFVCEDCLSCEECFWQMETHCIYCENCFYGSEDELCHTCFGCEGCMGDICEYCGDCEDCALNYNEHHCPECYSCYDDVPECDEVGGHCTDCCLVCEECDVCLFDEGLEICEDCGLCELCCEMMAQDLDCSCGEYCAMSSDFEEHICPDCEVPFCMTEMCEICEKCLDCCESESDCGDGMCVEDDEYEAHFCQDCGQCYHDVDMCEHCYDEGENRCIECCEAIKEDEGDHKAEYKASWFYNESGHYHECKYCDEQEHFSKIEAHSFNGEGVCSVCKYNNGSAGIFTQHPKSVTVTVTDVRTAGYYSPLSDVNNKVTFTVKAKGAVSYQWYYKYDESKWMPLRDEIAKWQGFPDYPYIEGATTDTLKISVPGDACNSSYQYKCVVKDKNGNEYSSNIARINAKHAYSDDFALAEYGNALMTIPLEDGKSVKTYENIGHRYYCLGDGCEKARNKDIEPHTFSPDYKVLKATNGTVWHEYKCTICSFQHRVMADKDDVLAKDEKTDEKAQTKPIGAVEIKSITDPVAGAKPDYSGHPVSDTYKLREVDNDYTKNGIAWYDVTEKKFISPEGDTFIEGHTYQVKVYLIASIGHAFEEKMTGEISGNVADVGFAGDIAVVSRKYTLKKTAVSENPFTDVKESDYFASAVKWAYESGVTTGTSATTFDPMATCTRGQVVTFLWRAAGSPEPKTSGNPFSDVSKEDYFHKAVIWALENGITAGTSANEFSPKATCSSAHIITFLYRAAGIGSDGWYREARGWAMLEGLLDGTGIKVAPDENCPRGAVVTFLHRFYK